MNSLTAGESDSCGMARGEGANRRMNSHGLRLFVPLRASQAKRGERPARAGPSRAKMPRTGQTRNPTALGGGKKPGFRHPCSAPESPRTRRPRPTCNLQERRRLRLCWKASATGIVPRNRDGFQKAPVNDKGRSNRMEDNRKPLEAHIQELSRGEHRPPRSSATAERKGQSVPGRIISVPWRASGVLFPASADE